MKKDICNIEEYNNFLIEIKEQIRKSQYEILKSVNKTIIDLYWNIGMNLSLKQDSLGWGSSVVEKLAKDLKESFPSIKGFSSSNLWRMKSFYNEYKGNEKLAPLVREISWSNNLTIMEKCKDNLAREFYIKSARKFGWTKNVLINQIENQTYEKYLLNQTNFDNALSQDFKNQAKLAIKDEYTFDFLELSENHLEKELEKALVKNIQSFLQEMGANFTFVGEQYKINVGGEDFYIDLLLYHRILKSFIVIELKVTSFKPEYLGQLQFYLTAVDNEIKLEDENPSIGILICKDKNRTVVEYALKAIDKPVGVSSYELLKKLPTDLSKLLPTTEEIEERLESL